MSLWIKICGNTSLGDAQMAVDAGADAVGFVFAPSPRRVTVAEAAAICSRLPENLEKIGVFVDAGPDEIESSVRAAGLTGVQLHFDADPTLAVKLRERLGASLRILRVVHFRPANAKDVADGETIAGQIRELAADTHLDGVLVDSRTATAVGGTGVPFDWAEAWRTVFGHGRGLKLIAAGGLSPANVAEAIMTLQPWGVDVVSGVEAAPGRKDPFKVQAFVKRARAASVPVR